MNAVSHDQLLRSDDDLLELFFDAMKPASEFRIGSEMEKFGVVESSAAPIGYEGPKGIQRFLEHLVANHGWRAEAEYEGGPVMALRKSGASVTLEPGCQLELSGAPLASVHEVDSEFHEHLAELSGISKELGVTWLGLGFHPFAARADLAWVPKLRYGIMRTYLPTRGGHALDMMLRTATVQANYDYTSEADAMRKLRVSLRLAPLTTAMFANSPFYEGKPHGGVTFRGRVWLDVDPDRSGLIPSVWNEGATLRDYVNWAVNVPMFMIKRDGKAHNNAGQTFRDYMTNGFEGHRATFGDWENHVNTLFPEVRLKKTIEIRGADAQRSSNAAGLAALYTGLLYDDRALAEAEALAETFSLGAVTAVRDTLWKEGLRANFAGKTLASFAERLVDIAQGGLDRRAVRNARGQNESVHLASVRTYVEKARCPADDILGEVAALTAKGAPFSAAVVQVATLR